MAPTIRFLAGGGSFPINDLSGSGLGFYSAPGFGSSVGVGQYQQRTFITDATGTNQGPEVNNIQYLNIGSGILGQTGSGLPLRYIPNWQAPLNIRFTNDSPCKVQNALVMIYDRYSVANSASGVTTQVAELIHPNPIQGAGGSGANAWTRFDYTTPGQTLSIANSPGYSGLSPNGANTTDTQHDWYIALSASPDSIGSKQQYALYASLEYL